MRIAAPKIDRRATAEPGGSANTHRPASSTEPGLSPDQSNNCGLPPIFHIMPTFDVYCGDLLVGYSELESGDPPMGVAFGQFIPSDGYSTIQRQCIENHADQTKLGLSVRTPNNETIICAGVGILDYSEQVGEGFIELNVLGISYPLYEQLFPEHVARYEQQFK
ncbi:hypothetical protein [Azovibrio restrictus]|uniref:hypothetical protein n=1 Tax=Azovibrio restrictus TaxID=146938 RepID=UPI001B7FBF0D|nr:hypothetical protein [Azovibrio restrictus]